MDTLLQDLRYALRTLVKAPAFAAVAVLTLALGIGATTSIFSVIEAAMLRPLPFREPERLMQLYVTVKRVSEPKADSLVWSYPKLQTMRSLQRSYASIAAYSADNVSLTGTGDPERLRLEFVSGSYFDLLGVRPLLGRGFVAEEDSTPGTHAVAILSDALWRRRYGADQAIVGRVVEVDKRPHTVIGVAPAWFRGLSGNVDLWVPLAMAPVLSYPQALQERWSHWLDVVGRLKPGVAPAAAAAEMLALGATVQREHPLPFASPDEWGAAAEPMRDARSDPQLRRAVLVLFGAVAFVLLIACANVANLQLARAAARRREVAVRVALGAGRGRLVRQLMTESVLLAVAGGALGIVVALWGMDVLRALTPEAIAGRSAQTALFLDLASVRLNGAVLGFAAAAALLTAILFGLAPALQATRTAPATALKAGAPGALSASSSLRRPGLRPVLAAAEIALSLVLLIGAGLMLRSFARARGVDAGFDPAHVLTFRLSPPSDTTYTFRKAPEIKAALLERLAAIPGVRAAAVGECPPLSNRCNRTAVRTIAGRPPYAEGTEPPIGVHTVSLDYFSVLRIPLRRGRSFDTRDRAGSPKVVILNETAARTLFPGEDAVGQRIGVGVGYFDWDSRETAEIVGVVGDVRYGSVETEPEPQIYLPALAYTYTGGTFMLRTAGDPAALAPAVRRAVLAFDRDLPVYDVKTMEARIGDALSRMRFSAFLLAIFSAVALLLAAVGVYGVMAYAVAQRTREIGIRMALGAQRGDVLGMVVRQGAALAVAGIAVGVLGAAGLTRVLAGLLYGVSATDPATFAAIAALLGAVALAACWFPARRATRVDPLVALRHE